MPIDYRDYHPKWSLITRLVRFRRAGGSCEWCGALHREPHPLTGKTVYLATAHLDRDRRNNAFANLAALCQRCHLHHDLRFHVTNRKYGRNWRERQLGLPFREKESA